MKLQVTVGSFKHNEYVTGCGWVGTELYSCSDDKTVHKISSEGDDQGTVTTLESYPTDLHWFPSGKKRAHLSVVLHHKKDEIHRTNVAYIATVF